MPTIHRNPPRRLLASSTAVLAVLAMVVPASAAPPATGQAARPRPAALTPAASTPAGTVTTADGLALTVNTNGSVGTVRDGARTLPRTTSSSGGTISGGFALRMVGGQANLLKNAGFESAVSTTSSSGNWRFPTGTYSPLIDAGQHRSGVRSAKIAIAGTAMKDSLVAYQDVSVTAGTSYVVGGYSKTSLLGPSSTETTHQIVTRDDAPAMIVVNMLDSSGRTTRGAGYRVKSYTGTTSWSLQSMGVKAFTGETRLRISILVRQGYGTVWFDDLSVAPTFAPSTSPLTTIATASGGRVIQTSAVVAQPLQLQATYEPIPDATGTKGIRIVGEVRHLGGSPADRAFQLTYTLPVGAAGWNYGDTARTARVIANGTTYTFDTSSVFPAARYPWATVFDSASNISLGSPLSKPRGYALRYNANSGLQIVFDLGASTAGLATDIRARHATFEIQLFRAAPGWGFRAATEKYYQLNPQSFVRRTDWAREGIPFYSPPLDQLDIPTTTKDESRAFNLGLNVVGLGYTGGSGASWGKPYVVWDEQNGRDSYSAAYTHQWGYFQVQCDPGPQTCAKRTYDGLVSKLRADAALSCAATNTACQRKRDEAAAALGATARDQNQRLRYDFLAGDFRLRAYGDPALRKATPGNLNWSDAVMKYQLAEAVAQARDAGGTLDGIYVDSSSGMRAVWGNADDYDRAKWAVTTMPLTFSYDTGTVSYKSFFANYLQTQRDATWVHQPTRNMILVLDTNGKEQTPGGILATDLADWLLVENSLRDLEAPPASAGITVDSYALLKRTLAGERPITTVDPRLADGSLDQSTDPATLTGDTSVLSRVNQSLFYGIWPGPERWDSGNATTWWKNPNLKIIYNRYGPLLRDMGRSGWEPVTNAVASTSGLWLERYGRASDDDLIIALRNETGSTLSNVKVTVRLNGDGLANGVEQGTTAKQKVVRSGLTFSNFALAADGRTATFTVTVPAATTGFVRFDRPGGPAAP